MESRPPHGHSLFAGLLGVLTVAVPAAWAQSILNTNDNGLGSLRQTIADAAVGDTITFASNLSGSTILLTSGELLLNEDLTIDASALPSGLQINGNRASRIFNVASNATVVLNSLTITNGYAVEGGGIYNVGNLTVNHVTVSGNSAAGTNGANGASGSGGGAGGTGGNGNGGGIYNSGTLTVSQSTLSENSATGGTGGDGGTGFTFGGGPGGPGGNGNGSGIYNAGSLTLDGSTLSGNSAIGGFGGFGGRGSDGSGGFGGSGGDGNGGGIYNAGTFTANQSTLSGNSAGGGSGGMAGYYGVYGGFGGLGGNGNGGGIYNGGNLTMDQSTLSGNLADGGYGGYGGAGLFSNGRGGDGGNGNGGGSYNEGALMVNQSTLSGNSVTGGPGGPGGGNSGPAGSPGVSVAGGIYQANTLTLFNSIVAGNSLNEFFGAFTATGNNVTNGEPFLALLGNYGGSTKTQPPMPGSPAIDAGAATSFTTDQRGFLRPLGSAPDIGAVEGIFNTAIPRANLTRLADGSFQVAITSFSGPSHSVLAGTDVALPLNTWSNLGLAVEHPLGSGQFQFTDLQATNYAQRFYRITIP